MKQIENEHEELHMSQWLTLTLLLTITKISIWIFQRYSNNELANIAIDIIQIKSSSLLCTLVIQKPMDPFLQLF